MKEIDIYRRIIQCFKNDKPINSKDIKDVIGKYLLYHNLIFMVDKIVFNNEEEKYYDDSKGEIGFDTQTQICSIDNDEHIKSYIESSKIDIINDIIHELTHVEQNYLLHNFKLQLFNNQFLHNEFLNSFNLFKNNYYKYNEYHDYCLFEYYAFIRSHIKTEKICLKYLKDYITKESLFEYNWQTSSDLINLYLSIEEDKLSFPIYNNHIVCEKKIDNDFITELKKINSLPFDNFERLKRGMPISDEVLQYLYDVSEERIKTMTLFEDIKKIK